MHTGIHGKVKRITHTQQKSSSNSNHNHQIRCKAHTHIHNYSRRGPVNKIIIKKNELWIKKKQSEQSCCFCCGCCCCCCCLVYLFRIDRALHQALCTQLWFSVRWDRDAINHLFIWCTKQTSVQFIYLLISIFFFVVLDHFIVNDDTFVLPAQKILIHSRNRFFSVIKTFGNNRVFVEEHLNDILTVAKDIF